MKNLVINARDWSLELGLSGEQYLFSPAFCHTQIPSGLFAHSPGKKEGDVS